MLHVSTCEATRCFLKRYRWGTELVHIPVYNNFRDLGAHLNLTHMCNGATLTARLHKATTMARHLSWMHLSSQAKEMIVRCNILPAGLYGCEAAHINKGAMKQFRAAIARAIRPQSAKRSTDMTYTFTSCAKVLDPDSHVLYNRVASLRRIIAKHGE